MSSSAGARRAAGAGAAAIYGAGDAATQAETAFGFALRRYDFDVYKKKDEEEESQGAVRFASDDAEIARAAGLRVAPVESDGDNFKITTAADLGRAESNVRRAMDEIRVGQGYDVHAFAPGDAVILCGVPIPHDRALKGHSDADVAMHALTDAIFGALAEGDIGRWFPTSEPAWKGAPSRIFLEKAMERVRARGGALANADLTIICERPKIGPHAAAMIAELATIMGVDANRISVKATTSERLGFTGREEGIAAIAAATLRLP